MPSDSFVVRGAIIDAEEFDRTCLETQWSGKTPSWLAMHWREWQARAIRYRLTAHHGPGSQSTTECFIQVDHILKDEEIAAYSQEFADSFQWTEEIHVYCKRVG